ncbi:organic hydroperoxide resistance protein [Pseudomonas izuensis]|uniref:organic hydroperoxide resistance protein n=1 Tax=Pseudomonas izuensis TaxID=2684212 RepID=UPI00135BD874|nr:organic hydroperoxide resistance protein [Pseudomonas izuensis]
MNQAIKVLYTGKVHTVGARENGTARSPDGRLDIKLSPPGAAGTGTNPEQLFAAGWSACFETAMSLAARKIKVALPAELAIDAEVDLGMSGAEYFLRARLNVSVPGLDLETAQAIVDTAHQTCPYSKALRGNVDVAITVSV